MAFSTASSQRSPSPAKSFTSSVRDLDADTSYTGYDAGASSLTGSPVDRKTSANLVPSVRLDQQGFEDVRLAPPTSPAPAREGFGSRLLSNAPGAAAALSRSSSVLHSRARSWVAYAQKLNAGVATSTPSSPRPDSPATDRAQSPIAVDKTRGGPGNRLFGDLFAGESAPVQLGLPTSPTKDGEDSMVEDLMEYRPELTSRPTRRPGLYRSNTQRSASSTSTTASIAPPAPTTRAPRTSWFGRTTSRSQMTTPTKPARIPAGPAPASSSPTTDELATMNINSSLFPHGPADPLSPHAFNDLLLNATSLLQRLQAAYNEKCAALADVGPEMDATREEAEEAATRARHLKLQLEDVARRCETLERQNQGLSSEVRRLEEDSRRRRSTRGASVRMIREEDDADAADQTAEDDDESDGDAASGHLRSGESLDGGDDTTPRRHHYHSSTRPSLLGASKRASAGSASDSGFESDAETTHSLLFSTAGSTVTSASSITSSSAASDHLSSPPPPPPKHASSAATKNPWALRPSPSTASAANRLSEKPLPMVGGGPNAPSAPWMSSAPAALEQLRGENAAMRRQVAEMQGSLQGCIEFVEGVVANARD